MRVPLIKPYKAKHSAHGYRALTVWRTAAVLLTAAVVMALLGAEPLREKAEAMEPSALQSVAAALTGAFATGSAALHVDWPWQQVAATGEDSPPHDPDGEVGATVTSAPPPTSLPATTTPTTGASPGATSTSSTTTTVSITTTTTLPSFTSARPLRVLVVGDSLMNPIGYALMRQAEVYPALKIKSITKASTGLVRPDVYNWPQVIAETVADYHPHVTVMLFGGNEKQVMRHQGVSFQPFSDEWNAEYAKRVDQVIGISTTAGASVIWIGLPIMRSSKFSQTVRTLNSFYSAACSERPGATYIDGYALFSDPEGKYSAYLVDSAGENRLMRAGDGIHFTDHGGDRVAEEVVNVLLTKYRLE